MATVSIQVCDRCADRRTIAVNTRRFEQGGAALEMDLCTSHDSEWEAIEQSRQVFVDIARAETSDAAPESPPPPETPRKRVSRPRDDPHAQENRELRDWAKDNGIEIGDRGRIPEAVRQRFREWRWNRDHPVPVPPTPEAAPVLRPPERLVVRRAEEPQQRPVPRPPLNGHAPPATSGNGEREFSVDDAMATHSD